jgi:hypothetical protein
MILSNRAPNQTSLPAPRTSWKVTTVEDVKGLLNLLEGRDPAWRFLEVRQIDEMKRNVERILPEAERLSALNDINPSLSIIEREIAHGRQIKAPFLARELCVAAGARERAERWESGQGKDFGDAPFPLRLLLNARVRQPSKRLNDLLSSSTSSRIDEALCTARLKGWIEHRPGEGPALSPDARERIIGCFRSGSVRPLGAESLPCLFNVSAQRWDLVGEKIAQEALRDVQFRSSVLSHPTRKELSREPLSVPNQESLSLQSKTPIVEHALEVISTRERYSREEVARAVQAGFALLHDSSVRATALPTEMVKSVAAMFVPNQEGLGPTRGGEFYLRTFIPSLRSIPCGFESWISPLQALLDPKYREGSRLRNSISGLQRELVSLVGYWFSRDDVPVGIREDLKKILVKEATSVNPRALIQTSMYWITKNHSSFSDDTLRRVSLDLLARQDREYLYHSLYISAKSERERGAEDMIGSLEMVTTLLREKRLTLDDGVAAFREAGMYIIRRCREESNGLWRAQQRETEALMAGVDSLCNGAAERDCREELNRKAAERRTAVNAKVYESQRRLKKFGEIARKYSSLRGDRP